MVSLPDELLRIVDREARRWGTTRSALLRELVEGALSEKSARRARRIAEIDRRQGLARGHGGNVAELVKLYRPQS